jgi:hypothetical protein
MAKCYPPPKEDYLPYNYDGEMKVLTVRQHLANGVPVRELRRVWSKRVQWAERSARRGNSDSYAIKL